MSERDQAMRNAVMNDVSLWNPELDKKHAKRMKQIIANYGWPTISMVGWDASQAAWILIQHADHDTEFQESCLDLLKQLPVDDVRQSNIAYLEDRVRVARNRPQLYGTQFDATGDNFGPRLIEDRQNLDKRREQMGLSTFAEYEQQMRTVYGR